MSIPAWKQAILEKKKQQEEAEKKKQEDQEKYLASLPPWKRAMLKMKTDGAAASPKQEQKKIEKRVINAFASSTNSKPSWVQTRVRKDSNEKASLQNGEISKLKDSHSSVETTPQQTTTDPPRKLSKAMAMKGMFEQPQNKFSQQKKDEVKKDETIVTKKERVPDTAITSAKQTEKEDYKTPAEKLPTVDKVITEKPEVKKVATSTTDSGLNKLRGQFEHQSADKNKTKPDLAKTQAASIDIDDEKFKSLPKWRQDLILRKKMKTEDLPKFAQKATTEKKNTLPPVNSTLSVSTKDPSSPVSKSPPVTPTQTSSSSSTPIPTIPSSKTSALPEVVNAASPEVVNASDKKDPDSPKMVHREGTELKPPVFKVKKKWADMKEDDPDFKSLPEWKRTLILRRKNDVKTRTAPPEKKEEKKEEKSAPLPEPLWTPPTRSVPVREIPNEPEKEETNPLLDMRKSLRHVHRPSLTPEDIQKPKGMIQPKVNENEFTEAEESLSPLKPKQEKRKKSLRRVSWSDTDLNNSLTVEFTYPKYSYEDYFEIDQNSEEKKARTESTDSNELATPIHPSLSSPTKNSSPISTGPGSAFGDSSDVNTASTFDSGTPKTFSFSGMPSLGSFMSAYTSGVSAADNYSSPAASSSFNEPVEKQNPIEETSNKVDEEIDENAAALLW